jgi:hypothetical protein
MEAMRALVAVRGDHHPNGEGRAILQLAERAKVVGDALGKHRHDPVGEIDRVAPVQRLAVEGAARPHVPSDVGDGDGDDVAAGVARVGIGRGMDGVVVILGVRGVDGHKRQRPPVLAAGECRGRCGVGLGERFRREYVRDVVGKNGDQAHRLLALHRPDDLGDPAVLEAEPSAADDLDPDEVAFPSLPGFVDDHFPLLALDRLQPRLALAAPDDADHCVGRGCDQLDRRGDVFGAGHRDPRQDAVADPGNRTVALGGEDDPGRRLIARPIDRLGQEVAVAVAAGDRDDRERWDVAGALEPAGLLFDQALLGQIRHQVAERDPGSGALDAEGAGDVALASASGMLGDERQDLLAGRQ